MKIKANFNSVLCIKPGRGFIKNFLYAVVGYHDEGLEIINRSVEDFIIVSYDGDVLTPIEGSEASDAEPEFELFDLELLNNSELAEVLPEKVVKPDDALDEGRQGGGVHDVGDGEVEKGWKIGSVFESLCRSEESVAEKFDVAKRIRVSEGVVVGDGTGDTCSVSDGGVSLFGFHSSYFTKFKTPGWVPSTLLDLAMTSVFAQAMLGRNEGMMWFNLNRKFAWKGL